MSLCANRDPLGLLRSRGRADPSTHRRFSCGCTFGKCCCGLGEGARLHCDIKTATSRTWKIHLHLLGAAKPPEPSQVHQQRSGGVLVAQGVSKEDKHGTVTSRSFLHKTPPVSRAFPSLMWKTSPQEPQDGEIRKRKSSVKPGSLFGQALEKDGWKRLQGNSLRVSKWKIDYQDVL